MQLAFLLTGVDIGGGTSVMFEHAVRMHRRGIEISMLTTQPISPAEVLWHPEAAELNWLTYSEAERVEFDGVIATAWPTCYDLARFHAQHYLYFNQSVESWFYAKEDWVMRHFADAAYLLPLKIITEATWIQAYLQDHYGLAAKLVRNGVRKDIYTEDGPGYAPRETGKLRVLIEGRIDVSFKNVPRTIELCRTSLADELWLLTPSAIQAYPGIDRVFSRIPISETPTVYRSCDVLVKLSYIEGMFGPPLEMFHCGGTVIVYDVNGYDEYIRHQENGIVVRTDDERCVVDSINALKKSSDWLDTLKKGARHTAAQWHNWDCASEQFENAIRMWMQQPSCSRKELVVKTQVLRDWHEKTRLQAKQVRKQQQKLDDFAHSKEYALGKGLLSLLRLIKHALP